MSPATAIIRICGANHADAVFRPELAANLWRRAHGLMGRRHLPADGGMLFIYRHPRVVRLWMANTPLPLDQVFIDAERRVAKIAIDRAPNSLRQTSSDAPVQWVLEVPAGTIARHGIQVGDRVEIDYRGD